MELSVEQKRAIAIASARLRMESPEGDTSPLGVAAEGVKGLVRGASGVGRMMAEQAPKMAFGPVFGGMISDAISGVKAPGENLVKANPQNDAERFASTAGEIGGAGVATGGAGSVRSGVITGLSALGGAIGERSGGETGKMVGSILPAAMDIAFSVARGIPKNIVAKNTQSKLDSEFSQRGAEVSKKTGIDLSVGQQTGDEAILTVEGMAAKNPFAARKFQEFGGKQVSQALARLNKIVDDISPDKMNDIKLGQIVNKTFDDAVDASLNLRARQAAADFGEVTKASGNAKIIQTKNLSSKIDEIINEFDVPGGGDASATLVNKLKGLKTQIEGKALTANETGRLLEVYSKASAGKGQLFKDLDTAQQRLIAGRVKEALLSDLDAAASDISNIFRGTDKAAALLKTARDNYRANSQAINKLEESVLGKYLGQDKSPERVAEFVLKAKPTELQSTLGILNKTNPESVPQVRRYFVEKAIENAALPPSRRNPSAPNFSAAKFIDAMPEGQKFDVLFGSSGARNDLKMVGDALERIAYRGFTEGSPTAPLMMAWDASKKLFTIQGLAGLPAAVIAPKTIAEAALTKEGRKAIVTLASHDKANQSVIRAAAYLSQLNNKESQKTE